MPKRDQLTYYARTSGTGAPEMPTEETKATLRELYRLDHKLDTLISTSDTIKTKRGDVPMGELLQSRMDQYASQKKREFGTLTDVQVFDVMTHAVSDWLVALIRGMNLDEHERALMRRALFDNGFGRAGLSMIVDMACLLLSEQAQIQPIHFAHSSSIPQDSSQITPYQEKALYLSYFQKKDNLGVPEQDEFLIDSFTRCSFGGMSSALVEKFLQLAPQIDMRIFGEPNSIVVASEPLREKKRDDLVAGVSEPDGVLYQLAEQLTAPTTLFSRVKAWAKKM